MKHILVIVGSCRKNGNTEQLADAFIRGAQDAASRGKSVPRRQKDKRMPWMQRLPLW